MPNEQAGFQHQDASRPSDQASENAPEREALRYATAEDSGSGAPVEREQPQNGHRRFFSRLAMRPVIAGGALAAVTAMMLRKRRGLGR